MTAIAKTKKAYKRAKPSPAKRARRSRTESAVEQASPKRYTVSDGTLLLNLEVEGRWFVVTSPLDPELVTQAKTIEEAFRMAYDAKELLEEYRAELVEDANARRSSAGV